MLERGKLDRGVVELVDTESLFTTEHLLRKIEAAVDFDCIYEMAERLYSEDNGRPGVDPVVLFKMVLIQHLYGLSSLRRTAEEINLNVAYRWFLVYTLQEETTHFSSVSYNFRHRFTTETVDRVFAWILEEVNADRETHGRKPFDDEDEPPISPKKRKDNTSRKKLARRK